MTQTNVTGIQNPAMFNLDVMQAGASNQAGVAPTGISSRPNLAVASTPTTGIQTSPVSESSKLEDELATIRALNQGQTSGGLGKTIGGAAGTGAGAYFGGSTGAAVGGSAGSAVGSIVDYMIEKDANDEAQIIRENALRKEKNRNIKKASTNAWLENLASMKGVALSEEQAGMDKRQAAKSVRENFMANLMNKIAQGTQRDEILKNKFLKSRSL